MTKRKPTCNVQCWSKDAKQKANAVQPEVLNPYNKSMGGADKHD